MQHIQQINKILTKVTEAQSYGSYCHTTKLVVSFIQICSVFKFIFRFIVMADDYQPRKWEIVHKSMIPTSTTNTVYINANPKVEVWPWKLSQHDHDLHGMTHITLYF